MIKSGEFKYRKFRDSKKEAYIKLEDFIILKYNFFDKFMLIK